MQPLCVIFIKYYNIYQSSELMLPVLLWDVSIFLCQLTLVFFHLSFSNVSPQVLPKNFLLFRGLSDHFIHLSEHDTYNGILNPSLSLL